jgi:Family of unknown function (DUF5397)
MNDASSAERTNSAQEVKKLVGEFKRFGPHGPVYEIVRIVSEQDVYIRVFTSGEELEYPISEMLEDPIAETIP